MDAQPNRNHSDEPRQANGRFGPKLRNVDVVDPAAPGARTGTGTTAGADSARGPGNGHGGARPGAGRTSNAEKAVTASNLKPEVYVPRILMLHNILCRWLGPEMAISEPEALQLARDYCNWRKHYGGIFDPKTEALLTLAMTACAIEGPRLMRVSHRRSQAKRAAKAEAQARDMAPGGTVVPMQPVG